MRDQELELAKQIVNGLKPNQIIDGKVLADLSLHLSQIKL